LIQPDYRLDPGGIIVDVLEFTIRPQPADKSSGEFFTCSKEPNENKISDLV
jgi:hypothetical protein